MNRKRPSRQCCATLATLVAAALLASAAVAQGGPGGGPPPYDKKTEGTVKGPILEVKPVQTQSGVEGTHLMLKDGKGQVEVFAGPTPFLTKLGATFAKGEAIEVVGSRMEINGTAALLARTIKKGGKTFEVRDESGKPLWARPPQ